MEKNKKSPWKTLKGEVKYDNPWIKVTEYDVITPGGDPGIYGKIHFKNTAIGIIPLDKNNNTWLVGQYRYPLDIYSWEIPEGGGKLSHTPLESAKRELLEETGIKAGQWKEILKMHISNSVTDEAGVIFIAKDLSFHTPQPDETEDLKIKKVPFDEVFQMVMDNKITDSLAVAGVLKTKVLMEKGEV